MMDTFAALAFGGEPALDRYMRTSPIPRTAAIISADMWYVLYCLRKENGVLYCIAEEIQNGVLYCIVLYCIVLYCLKKREWCIVLYCGRDTEWCIVLYCIVLYCGRDRKWCIVLYCIVLYCIVEEIDCKVRLVVYCIVLYCIPFPLRPLPSLFHAQVFDYCQWIVYCSCLYCILDLGSISSILSRRRGCFLDCFLLFVYLFDYFQFVQCAYKSLKFGAKLVS